MGQYGNKTDPQTGKTVIVYRTDEGHEEVVRDIDEHRRQHQSNSHLDFFEKQNQRVRQRRMAAIQREVQMMAADRMTINSHPNVRQVSDDTFKNELIHDPEFEPLNTYIDLLKVKRNGVWNGKWHRQPLTGEVGMYRGMIYTLEPAYGRPVAPGYEKEESHGI